MDLEQQGNDEWERFEKSETKPDDGFEAFKKTLKDFIGLKSKKKGKHGVPYQTQMNDDKRGHVIRDTKRESQTASITPDVPQKLQNNKLTSSYPESLRSRTQQSHHEVVEDNTYSFRHEKCGFAVLVINSEFDTQSERESADWDVCFMMKMFLEMGFDVKILQNLTSKEKIQQQITMESDCFACVISSHGLEGQAKVSGLRGREPFVRTEHFVYTRNGVVRTSEHLELFNDRNCRNLKGKLRMLFIQACRGRIDLQKDDEVDMGVEIPVDPVHPQTNQDSTLDAGVGWGGIIGDYTGRHSEEYMQTGNQHAMNLKFPKAREGPSLTTTYKDKKPETKPENIEVFQIPCFNDFLVMFSSATGTIAWSDSGKGGWLMYTLYHVFNDVTYTDKDLLTTLTGVCGMMVTEMQTYCPSNLRYDKARSAACVYDILSKDI